MSASTGIVIAVVVRTAIIVGMGLGIAKLISLVKRDGARSCADSGIEP